MCHFGRLVGLLCLILSSISVQAEDQKKVRPNIVILYADDMGYGDLGVQNPDSKIPTPNLDQLAQSGMRFTDAHSSSGICTPSRYALLSGRYHWRKFHNIVFNFGPSVMDTDRTNLAKLLKSQKYVTGCVGKWHLGWDWKAIQDPAIQPKGNAVYPVNAFDWTQRIPGGPVDHGFDSYFGDDVPNFPPYAWFENDKLLAVPTVPVQTPPKPKEGNWEVRQGPSVKDWDFYAVMPKLTDRAEQWIGQQTKEQPFFLYFPFTSPHAPIIPTEEFDDKSKAKAYGDFVVQSDATVGRILTALKKHGFEENTIVIFTSDNGPEQYAYERVRQSEHRSMGPLRGLKRDIYEGGHRVPFLAKWPGNIPAGTVNDGLIGQIDIYATLASILKIDIPKNSADDSYDQSAMFLKNGKSQRDTIVHNTYANGYALRHGDWVLIDSEKGGYVTKCPPWFEKASGFPAINPEGELYNLRDDLGQKKNLYAQKPELVAELRDRLAKLKKSGQVR